MMIKGNTKMTKGNRTIRDEIKHDDTLIMIIDNKTMTR